MPDERCHTRIGIYSGTNYMVTETVDEVMAQIESGSTDDFVSLTSMTGQTLFPPEILRLRIRDITVIQEMSEAGWLWSKRATELHYARQIEDLEQAPWQRIAEAHDRMVEVLKGEVEDD